MLFVSIQMATGRAVDGRFDGTLWKDGQPGGGADSARTEGIANHSTGDLNGLVASAHQPGMETESWRGGGGGGAPAIKPDTTAACKGGLTARLLRFSISVERRFD